MIPAEVIAEALAKHHDTGEHSCDYHCAECGTTGPLREFAAHQAAVVAAIPDIAIVPRVEPDEIWEGNADENGWKQWRTDSVGDVIMFSDGEVHVDGKVVDSAALRHAAAALLAAAAAAEEDQ